MSSMGKLVASGLLLAVLWAPCARADDDVVKYRRPDGSIGFAQDRASVPKGATIIRESKAPKSRIQTGESSAPAAPAPPDKPRAELKPAAKPKSAPAAVQPDDEAPSVEDHYRERRDRLDEEAAEARKRAADPGVPCRERPSGRMDCRERDHARQQAEKTVKEHDAEREKLIEDCEKDDDCRPGQLMD